jgi:signal transduction histidine kinase
VIRSLRARFFLTVWPLVVAALVAVGLFLGRWTRVELDRFESVGAAPHARAPREGGALADSAAASWDAVRARGGGPLHRLRRLAPSPAEHLVVVDTAGALVAATDPALRPADVRLLPNGSLELVRRALRGRALHETVVRVRGAPVVVRGRRVADLLVVDTLPRVASEDALAPPAAGPLAAAARRTIWTTVLLASLVAALATVLLARPVVGQVGRLADAARRIRGGALHARVRLSSADELGELERSFNEMAESLERAEAQKRRMISDVAHELRTPLTNVIGLLEAVRDGLRAPDAGTLDAAREEARLLHALVDELQELSVAESGAMRFDLEVVDAVEEARRAVAVARGGPGGPSVLAPTNGAPVPVRADRRRLAQVLRNLLRNAVTYTPAGGVVRVEVAREGPDVAIRVIDTGSGIPPEQLPLVWERFHRVDPSRSRSTGGVGPGLAVVRQLVEGMGGRVWAESEVGRGSTFAVVLPAGVNNLPRDASGR